MAGPSAGRPGQLAGYGQMPGPERVLTWSGEPQGRRREASGPEDTLDASAVNRPRAVPYGTDDDRPGLAGWACLSPVR
jgi:hypothetical protein